MLRRPHRWSFYDEFDDIRRQMDQMMNIVSPDESSLPLPETEEGRDIVPFFGAGRGHGVFQVDVSMNNNEVIVTADMAPGVEKKNISMELLTPKALQITCERKMEREEMEGEEGDLNRYYLRERRYGSQSRVVPLPQAVNPEDAKASFENGVLEIRLPIRAIETKRRIAIE